ncbi:hypothetical protein ABIE73_004263 [Bradyrhizobium yuanmingense]
MSMLVAVVMVGMIAMLVVVMVVLVAMVVRAMIMEVTMVMVMMAVIVMRMVVSMRVAGIGVGAAFGIERRLDLDYTRAKALHHRLDDVIAADAQGLGHDLGRQMTVAEMPADADEVVRIAAADFEQRLGRRDHLDQPSILQHQRIAAAQRDGMFQVEQEFETTRSGHRHAAAVPVVEIEHDRVHWRFREAVLSPDLRRPDHASYLFTVSRPSRA